MRVAAAVEVVVQVVQVVAVLHYELVVLIQLQVVFPEEQLLLVMLLKH